LTRRILNGQCVGDALALRQVHHRRPQILTDFFFLVVEPATVQLTYERRFRTTVHYLKCVHRIGRDVMVDRYHRWMSVVAHVKDCKDVLSDMTVEFGDAEPNASFVLWGECL
jgi:hypothetical protein